MPAIVEPAPASSSRSVLLGVGASVLAMVGQNVGAGFAKQLFPLVGAYGVTALRIALAAVLLLAILRPIRRPVPRELRAALVAYGAMLGLMNLLIYQAFARLPIGIATGIEVMGPLAIVIWASRRPRDLVWLLSAVAGLAMLLPLRAEDALDPIGLLCAAGAAATWALYILFGKRVSQQLGGDAVAWGMLVATLFTAPIGLATAGAALFTPTVLLIGLAVAALSSALPYALEMAAMRRLPVQVFGIILSAYPAVAALAGFVLLAERLTLVQWSAIACIVFASAGSAVTASRD